MMAPIGNNCLTDWQGLRIVRRTTRNHRSPLGDLSNSEERPDPPSEPLAPCGTPILPPGRRLRVFGPRSQASALPSAGMARAAAFFDLDRTLLRGASRSEERRVGKEGGGRWAP